MLSRLFIAARERADLMSLVCDVYCDFVTFPFGILGQVWYLIVSIPDPCCFFLLLHIILSQSETIELTFKHIYSQA